MNVVAKFVRTECDCGAHLIDLFDVVWDDRKVGFYTCDTCKRPLLCRDENGKFYYVGEAVET